MRRSALFAAVAAVAALSAIGPPALRGAERPTGTIWVGVAAADGQEALAKRPALVTLLRDGVPLLQDEGGIGQGVGSEVVFRPLDPGVYDIRVEADGARTMVKRGILVSPDHVTVVRFQAEAGEGVKVVTYSLATALKTCTDDRAHLDAPPTQWHFCPVCGEKLK
jgi:hypothetical protein